MEKGELKTGQTLGIVEKNGKLVQEYVAGFFGNEPIIKQRLLTPPEARRYREDLARGKKPGQAPAGTGSIPGRSGSGAALLGRPGLKKSPLTPEVSVRTRPAVTATSAAEMDATPDQPSQVQSQRAGTAQPVASPATSSYSSTSGRDNDTFLQNLINSETDKPNFNPANRQKALKTISEIGSPDMRVYRIGKKSGETGGMYYSQKEYLARGILGLPLWKAKVEKPVPTENQVKSASETDLSVTSPVTTQASDLANNGPATYDNGQI